MHWNGRLRSGVGSTSYRACSWVLRISFSTRLTPSWSHWMHDSVRLQTSTSSAEDKVKSESNLPQLRIYVVGPCNSVLCAAKTANRLEVGYLSQRGMMYPGTMQDKCSLVFACHCQHGACKQKVASTHRSGTIDSFQHASHLSHFNQLKKAGLMPPPSSGMCGVRNLGSCSLGWQNSTSELVR